MRVAGQDQIAVALGGSEKGGLQSVKPFIEIVKRIANPQFDSRDNLIIPATPRVQLAADVAQPFDESLFDVCVDVFELDGKGEFATINLSGNGIERRSDAFGFIFGEQSDLRQHAGVGLAGRDVVPVKPAIKANRFGEGFNAVIGLAAEAATPGFMAHEDMIH